VKRAADFLGALLLGLLLSPVLLIAAAGVKLTSPGPVLHRSRRVGFNNCLFTMYKFRTMVDGAPQVATHLLTDARSLLTPVGGFLRRTSIDELPQLLNVLKGDMSLVGPRPALFNQHDLVAMRTEEGVHRLRPGITGWAQINGRDELPLRDKVALDAEYVARRNLAFDLKILWRTMLRTLTGSGVSH